MTPLTGTPANLLAGQYQVTNSPSEIRKKIEDAVNEREATKYSYKANYTILKERNEDNFIEKHLEWEGKTDETIEDFIAGRQNTEPRGTSVEFMNWALKEGWNLHGELDNRFWRLYSEAKTSEELFEIYLNQLVVPEELYCDLEMEEVEPTEYDNPMTNPLGLGGKPKLTSDGRATILKVYFKD